MKKTVTDAATYYQWSTNGRPCLVAWYPPRRATGYRPYLRCAVGKVRGPDNPQDTLMGPTASAIQLCIDEAERQARP